MTQKTNNDVQKTHIDRIKLIFKKQEVSYIYDTFVVGMDEKGHLIAWDVAISLKAATQNSVIDHQRFTAISWAVRAVNAAIDRIDHITAGRPDPLSATEILNILDLCYENVCTDVAINWTGIGQKSKSYK